MKSIALLLSLFISFPVFANDNNKAPETEVGTILSPARAIEPFKLTDNHKKSFSNEQFAGQWSLLFFGFTRCTMICPTTMQMLSQLYQQLEKDHAQPMPNIILVSVDPENDTPADMNKYVTSFNPKFIGLTGKPDDIEKFARQMMVLYMKVKQNGVETIDHSGTILLINPEGKLYTIFSTPHDPKIIAKDYQIITKAYQKS
jgi:protein SCO1/2